LRAGEDVNQAERAERAEKAETVERDGSERTCLPELFIPGEAGDLAHEWHEPFTGKIPGSLALPRDDATFMRRRLRPFH
jgi:hypothetical protein